MDWYRNFLAAMPDPETVRDNAEERHPTSPVAELSHAAAAFEIYYLQCRDALTALVAAVQREDAARAATWQLMIFGPNPDGTTDPIAVTGTVEPPDEEDVEDEKDNEEFDTDDPEVCDVGRTPNVGIDPTRRDLREECR